MSSLAAKFLHLFAGLQRSHGIYVVPAGAQPTEKGKLHDTKWARTVHAPLTELLFETHLQGGTGLGVVPIRDDSSAVFGAIDIDIYPLDLRAVQEIINVTSLPLILSRTKSGGAHLWLFLEESVPAELIRAKLAEWSRLFERFKTKQEHIIEIFPKQDRLAPTSDGSWINLPYAGGSRSTRYALGPDGNALTPEQFIDYAHAKAITQDQLASFEIATEDNNDFEGGPPCLQTLAVKGFGDWQNSGLFNVAVFLRKKYGDEWEPRLDEYNQRYMTPPVDQQGLRNIIKSVSKKTYSYSCKQEPICSVCDKKTCKTRDFGISGLGTDPGISLGRLVKIETVPPTYNLEVDGVIIEFTTKQLMNQILFHEQVFDQINKWPPVIKPGAWKILIQSCLDRAETIPIPLDATHQGQFWNHVQMFCTSHVKGKSWDELLLHKPYTEDGRTYFCAVDLYHYLHQKHFNSVNEKITYNWMLTKGVKHHERVLKGKPTKYWSIPAFAEQTEEFTVPRAPLPERM